jgi:hypothetical protein
MASRRFRCVADLTQLRASVGLGAAPSAKRMPKSSPPKQWNSEKIQ